MSLTFSNSGQRGEGRGEEMKGEWKGSRAQLTSSEGMQSILNRWSRGGTVLSRLATLFLVFQEQQVLLPSNLNHTHP